MMERKRGGLDLSFTHLHNDGELRRIHARLLRGGAAFVMLVVDAAFECFHGACSKGALFRSKDFDATFITNRLQLIQYAVLDL